MSARDLPRFLVDTVRFSRVGRANLIASLESYFGNPQANNFVCVSNVHTTVECRANERLRRIQNDSFLTIADGQPIVFYSRLLGVEGVERIMGPDIMDMVFSAPECRERAHFFLGGTSETLDAMKRNLKARFPDLRIAGMHSPPFRELSPAEEVETRRMIAEARPDYLWVCFGAPKQEYWMELNHSHFPSSLLIGIGAGFAYHAGELRRAPQWVQTIACEWVWRLGQDPKRLWKRYLKTNPVFALLLAEKVLSRAFSARGGHASATRPPEG